jgi:hypothetical protein
MSKSETLNELRAVLAGMFDARYEGATAVRFANVQGFADGYMRALCDVGVTSEKELVALVNEERRAAASRADGPMASSLPPGPIVPHFA